MKISSPFGAQRAPEAPKPGQARTDGKRKTSPAPRDRQLSCLQNHSSTPCALRVRREPRLLLPPRQKEQLRGWRGQLPPCDLSQLLPQTPKAIEGKTSRLQTSPVPRIHRAQGFGCAAPARAALMGTRSTRLPPVTSGGGLTLCWEVNSGLPEFRPSCPFPLISAASQSLSCSPASPGEACPLRSTQHTDSLKHQPAFN